MTVSGWEATSAQVGAYSELVRDSPQVPWASRRCLFGARE